MGKYECAHFDARREPATGRQPIPTPVYRHESFMPRFITPRLNPSGCYLQRRSLAHADHACTRVCARVCVTRGGCSPGLAGAFLLRVSRSRSFPSRQPRTMQAPRGPCTWPMTPSTGRTLSGAPHASPPPPLPVGGEHDGIGTPGNGVFFTAFPAPGIVFLTWLLILPGAGDA